MSGGVDIPGLSRRLRGAVYDHVYDNHTHEVGGVLVGDLGEGEMPVVTGCIAALEARGERASVTFTHDAWSSIHAQMESDYPGKQIVGWYHSHPGFGIFLSGHDIFIQENFFSDPRQIAYVVDPHAGTEGVFGWRAGEVKLIEETPAGRQGTGGPRTPRAETTRSGGLVRYGGLAAVVAVFLGVGTALFVSAGEEARTPSPPAGQPGGVMRAMSSVAPFLFPPAVPANQQAGTVQTNPQTVTVQADSKTATTPATAGSASRTTVTVPQAPAAPPPPPLPPPPPPPEAGAAGAEKADRDARARRQVTRGSDHAR